MIKFLGKIRYHWQPEVSWAIIYWSLTLTPIFMSMALLFEHAQVPRVILSLVVVFFMFLGLGFHRFFTIESDGYLKISHANPFSVRKLEIGQIYRIEVTKTSITFLTSQYSQGKTYCMRKWPKKYLLDDLAINPHFKGEVELTDHLIDLDYFEVYREDRKKYLSSRTSLG